MTDVTLLDWRELGEAIATKVTHTIYWWSEALPVGFDYRSPPAPPDGVITLPATTIGFWVTQDWSFNPQTVQTMTIIENYDLNSEDQLLDELHFFLTSESAATFCP